ncbi:MAG: hypothetical protein CMJ13_00360 [Pelagibacterales bacterium]|nr:hypothetical protein [Pelagibacterales bacterium]
MLCFIIKERKNRLDNICKVIYYFFLCFFLNLISNHLLKIPKVKPINMASPITIIMCKKVDILVS